MSTLRVYACGGAGINIGALWKNTGRSQFLSEAQFIGLDTSKNNQPDDNAFEVEHMEGARGGGKDRGENIKPAPDFVRSALSIHKPGDFNIVLFGAAGASGGVLGPLILRELLDKNIPVVAFVIGDTTSQKEIGNTVNCWRSIDNQRKSLDADIVFDYVLNSTYATRGEANKTIVNRLDLLSVFLTDSHEEADYQDIRNALRVSRVTSVAPSLQKINFFDSNADLKKVEGNPVACISLYRDRDAVSADFAGVAYRVTGVLSDGKGPNVDSLHMVLDYDRTVKDIISMIAEQEDREKQSRTRYKAADELGGDADDNGIVI